MIGIYEAANIDADGPKTLPKRVRLYQNHPNPFNPVAKIGYSMLVPGKVVISVYNIIGEEVARLFDGRQ